MTILQNILFPTEERCSCEEMFFHRAGGKFIFDGYFNLFSAAKWRTYTTISHVAVRIQGKGAALIALQGNHGEYSELRVGETKDRYDRLLDIPFFSNVQNPADFIWFSYTPLSEGSSLTTASYQTEDLPKNPIRIAVDICTYHREAYVMRNLKVLEKSILDLPTSPLYNKLEIFIVDNGQSIAEESISHPHVHLFQNINAGGAGGFTRGMLEILKSRRKYEFTHVILLDDDAVMEPDAFIRAAALLTYIRDEYDRACIAGTLLDVSCRYMQNEIGATYNKGVTTAIGKGEDLRTFDTVCCQEKDHRSDYAGWWFACYPLSVVSRNNLPLPYFVHYDDMEYGLRNNNGNIYLNGICVWHASVDRQAQALLYYGIRNRLITNAIHTDITVGEEISFLKNAIIYDTLRYQYESANIILKAVEDFLRGPRWLATINPDAKNKEVRDMAENFESYSQIANGKQQLQEMDKYTDCFLQGKLPEPKLSKATYRFTFNGWFLPTVRKEQYYSIYLTDMRDLYRVKEAILIDPYNRKAFRAEKDWHKLSHNLCTILRICVVLRKRYTNAASSYQRFAEILSSDKFWRKYLKLEQKEE